MRRLGRWAFNALAVGSLLLFIAVGAAWAVRFPLFARRMHSLGDRWEFGWLVVRQPPIPIECQAVLCHYLRDYVPGPPAPPIGSNILTPKIVAWSKQFGNARNWGHAGGFFMAEWPIIGTPHSTRIEMMGYGYTVGAPPWIWMGFLAILPAIAAIRWRGRTRRQRLREGLCPVCGYDLRATPQRCPECGTVPVKQQVA
jgi:hypothetical protein